MFQLNRIAIQAVVHVSTCTSCIFSVIRVCVRMRVYVCVDERELQNFRSQCNYNTKNNNDRINKIYNKTSYTQPDRVTPIGTHTECIVYALYMYYTNTYTNIRPKSVALTLGRALADYRY